MKVLSPHVDLQFQYYADAQSIGVCYGDNKGDPNLPSKQEVVNLYKSNNIGRMRIYYPDEGALEALKGSNIELIIDVPRDTLSSLTNPNTANDWVNKYVKPYSQDVKIKYIAVGNEIRPSYNEAQYVLSAMQNIQNAISSANLQSQIKVSTAIDMTLIENTYPPSNGIFKDQAKSFIQPIINFLMNNESPLLANVYPYFAYANDPQHTIPLDYALFNQQGNNDAGYQNLFVAMLDSIYAAVEKIGGSNLVIVVSESGWPSSGGNGATTENAGTYYANLIQHVKGGTVKKPNGPIETYLFAMFDENQKDGDETERHFGLFTPDKSVKYQISFT